MKIALIGTTIGMVLANYLYQATLGNQDWSVALDRSWFQVCAIISVWIVLSIRERIV